MLFASLDFAAFFALTWSLHALIPNRWQNHLLLLASLYAYFCWKGCSLLVVLFSGCLDYWLGKRIVTSPYKGFWLSLSLGYNLALLTYFKYGLWLGEVLVGLGVSPTLFPRFLMMPVGLSFFTFQSMGYAIDLYRGRTRQARRLLDYLLFVSFFAQMMCGPIERARTLLRQLENPRRLQPQDVSTGLVRFGWGLFQKLVVADNLALPVTAAFARFDQLHGTSLGLALILFAVQLYCDFAGYTDMALGLAQMLGIRLSENFQAPYLARDLSDFWNRWNRTLMSWFRDYVYFPLAGRSEGRALAAAMVVFLLSGLWHGAAWHFVFWGLLNGAFVVWARLYAMSDMPPLPRLLRRVCLLLSLTSGLLFFRAPSLHEGLAIGLHILLGEGQRHFSLAAMPWEALLGFALVLAVDWRKEPHSFAHWHQTLSPRAQVTLAVTIVMGILLLGAKEQVNFLYLQF